MDEDVATAAVVDERLRWNRITGNYDGAVGCFQPEAKGIDHILMPHRKCCDRDIGVLVDKARHDLLRIDLAACGSFSMKAVATGGDVDLPSLEDALRHRLNPSRTINGEWLASSHDPG